ncbi:unnamed protein product [Ceratitis capitata]|uniref:(Mediterranean fruit fly) hypothetical protein n=1 Tax=Ceratitis capitata TaxID=7213 RepID=A0A811VDK9_CERCA|nr:unnamed protein product [Ceratitis capitata]
MCACSSLEHSAKVCQACDNLFNLAKKVVHLQTNTLTHTHTNICIKSTIQIYLLLRVNLFILLNLLTIIQLLVNRGKSVNKNYQNQYQRKHVNDMLAYSTLHGV